MRKYKDFRIKIKSIASYLYEGEIEILPVNVSAS